jgi:CTP:molybdopterin cytidylyltransferase MocA
VTDPVAGLVLAAGGGRRLGGRPKALLRAGDGTPLVVRAVAALREGGCSPVVVVLGAAAEEAAPLVPSALAGSVVADDWADGMGRSLRRGLRALKDDSAQAVVVTLVDLPDVTAAVTARVVDAWRSTGGGADALVRATYDGEPGHPVLIGRAHWSALAVTLDAAPTRDVGALHYLRGRIVQQVSCDDLATGRDLDRPADLDTWTVR